ncbi:MAG: N-acetylneuraminate synthase family protein, partial [Bdellovibrionales bacterium]|nr:N-acetylneuraminate synthase family protein [Bdellovibrionales bacterium]
MSITYLPEQSLTIGDRTVGVGHPPLLIAEIGINHNGEIERAKTLIRAAKKCGAHAVKFQKRNLEEIYTRDILEHLESYEQGFQYLIPILRRFELSNFEMRELKVFAESLGLLFLCTAFDETSAQFLHEIDLQAFKVSSA